MQGKLLGVESPEIAKERVRLRVDKDGHGISDKDIERKYYDSLKNLNNITKIDDEINIYDNTNILRESIYLKDIDIIWNDSKPQLGDSR